MSHRRRAAAAVGGGGGRRHHHHHHRHRHPHLHVWTRAWVLLVWMAAAAAAVMRPSGTATPAAAAVRGHGAVPSTQPAHDAARPTPGGPLLLWLPVHASEPDDNVDAALACLFRQWTPSLAGHAFDVLVTLAGDGAAEAALHARAAGIVATVSAGTAHIRPRPRILAHPIILAADIYDMDEARGRLSSYEGPNAVFYHVMTGLRDGSLRPEVSAVAGGGLSGARADGRPITVSAAMQTYEYVHLIETDCCATSHGWLDALMQPMLDGPQILISGSRGRGACWTGSEHGGCALTVDPAIPHAHLRDHINGNALYRVGPELGALIDAARAKYVDRVPFDVALHLMGAGDRAFDNSRSYSAMALPVDGARFADPAHYGDDGSIVFVHVPRRLRASSLDAAVRRVDASKPVTVVIVPPAMSAGDAGLLAHLHAGLARVGETRNALYVAMDDGAYVAASRLAPQRVLLAGDGGQSVQARTVSTLHALALANLTTFTLGLHAVVLHPYSEQLATLVHERPQAVWTSSAAAAAAAGAGASITQGLWLVPATAAAWLAALGDTRPASTTSVAVLPPDLFPPASSFAGPLWTEAARATVAAVVAWDGPGPPTPAGLGAVGLWSAPAPTCANHSVLAAVPVPLTSSFAAVQHALAMHAAFDRFVRRHAIACVVVPGFRLGAKGTTVPAWTVVRGVEDVGDSPAPLVFRNRFALETATGGQVGRLIPFDGAAQAAGGDEADAATKALAPALAALVDTALAALPRTYHCVLDGRRSARDVKVLALDRGRLDAVAAAVRQLRGGKAATPTLLTGAWRHVGGWPAPARIVTLADIAAAPAARASTTTIPTDPMADYVRHSAAPASRKMAASPWADIIEYAACQRAAAVHKLDAVADAIPAVSLDQVAAHIPPAALAEDLTTLAGWLGRPDKPASLAAAKRATLVLPPATPAITAATFADAVLAPAVGLAHAGGADLVALPRQGGLRPWSALAGGPALADAHARHAGLLPASVSWLLDGPVEAWTTKKIDEDDEDDDAPHTSTKYPTYPASLDVWHAPEHAAAVRALEEAWHAGDGSTTVVRFPPGATPAQHARLKHFGEGARPKSLVMYA